MQLSALEARQRFVAARVLRLASADGDGVPHLVPATFAVDKEAVEDAIVIAVDHKPKRGHDLKRLRNIAENERVCGLVDLYDDNWQQLWWARADGVARIVVGAERERPLDLLAAKYPQYREQRPDGPVIAIAVHRWSGWAFG